MSYLQVRISFVNEKCGRKVAVIGTRNVDNLIKSGMNEHVAKPLDWQALAKVLQRWLK